MFTFNISLAVLLSAALLLSEKKLQVEANECYSNSDCGYGYNNKYCCKQRYSWQSHVCRSSCVGQSCSSDSDCGGPGECCSSSKYCTKSSCREYENILSWFIPVCVISAIVGLAILVACIYGVKRAMRGRAQPGIVVRQQQTGAGVIALQNTQTAESNPEQLQMPPLPSVYFSQHLHADSQPVAKVAPPDYAKY